MHLQAGSEHSEHAILLEMLCPGSDLNMSNNRLAFILVLFCLFVCFLKSNAFPQHISKYTTQDDKWV